MNHFAFWKLEYQKGKRMPYRVLAYLLISSEWCRMQLPSLTVRYCNRCARVSLAAKLSSACGDFMLCSPLEREYWQMTVYKSRKHLGISPPC